MYTNVKEMGGLDANILDTITSGIEKFAATAQAVTQNPLKAAIRKVDFYSSYSAPISYTADELLQAYRAPADTSSLMYRIKPTFVIDSPLVGRKVVAPYGEAKPEEWRSNVTKAVLLFVGGLAVFTAGGYYLGYRSGKRAR